MFFSSKINARYITQDHAIWDLTSAWSIHSQDWTIHPPIRWWAIALCFFFRVDLGCVESINTNSLSQKILINAHHPEPYQQIQSQRYWTLPCSVSYCTTPWVYAVHKWWCQYKTVKSHGIWFWYIRGFLLLHTRVELRPITLCESGQVKFKCVMIKYNCPPVVTL